MIEVNCLANAYWFLHFSDVDSTNPEYCFFFIFSIDFRSMNLFSCSAWNCEGLLFCFFDRLPINLSFPWFPWLRWLLCTYKMTFGGCWLSALLSGCQLLNPSNKCLTFVWQCFSCGNAHFPMVGSIKSYLILFYLALSYLFTEF